MPKLKRDEILQSRLHEFVRECGGRPARAASKLELNAVLIWRFLRTGAAIERNKEALREALDRLAQRGEALAPATEGLARIPSLENEITKQDVAQLKRILHHLLVVLDREDGQRA